MATSIQQASANALQSYLASQLSDCKVTGFWPSPDNPLPDKAITVLMAGPRHDESVELEYVGQVNGDLSSPVSESTWRVKVCEQDFQLDIWAHSDYDRDDILARLDEILNVGEAASIPGYLDPARTGVLLKLEDGWANSFADFTFEGPSLDDDPDSIKRSEYRATIRSTAFMSLSVTRKTAKLINLNVKEYLNGEQTAQITTVTPTGQTGSEGP